ncbi:malto-oligosyltrehalose trehalohydrolase [Rhizobium sp. LCM 4573]|uniref:malto-oligosyltrehalose trehalohydrolase n=1 Tax=Rhizobium sp. LCM 4573 TaxID=1848291 RepID=UPI0008DA7FA6|nr:malto-oligosyltrehalose trehalohydrolase [Rhizobium sp. LCM 4573]OHV82277.1 malto-oligosyltrehalose trehalohydrolase [Rhizobium sp. LCM 4573]
MSSLSKSANRKRSDHSCLGRRYPVGAELLDGGVSFRVWAPVRKQVSVVLEHGDQYAMASEERGYFSLHVSGMKAGTLYRLKLDGVDELLADPASRFQPRGPAGPSMVVDPTAYRWQDQDWRGVSPEGQVLYEMHIGTFTAEGTWTAAASKFEKLKDVGITCLEVMPANEFNGTFGWGYDGVLPYAPTHLYGEPDDLRAFVDTAHRLGIGAILDVVYNHFGCGERFGEFSPDYFTDRHHNEWGASINFDGPGSAAVREFVSKNAAYWIDEFHFDGLRIDATQALFDSSEDHVIMLIVREARAAAGKRQIYLVAENEPQDTWLVRSPENSGHGLDALWNDDFHHAAMVALTGRNEAYYHDHRGRAQEFVSAAKYGYLFQGQRYDWQDGPRGRPGLDLRPANFIHFLQNHDQIANSGTGLRMDMLTSPARIRAMTALLLLGPQTPMLFQGQEFGASSPFHYFADQGDELLETVRRGRIESLKQFPSLRGEDFARNMPVPGDPGTFERSKLDWSDWKKNAHVVALHRDLLNIRREQPAFDPNRSRVDGSILSDTAFLLRYLCNNAADERLLLINFGKDLMITSLPDPLLAPPEDMRWRVVWSSEDPVYGGSGVRPIDLQYHWTLTGDCALLLAATHGEFRPKPNPRQMRAWQLRLSGVKQEKSG